jgi:hypothetical protein
MVMKKLNEGRKDLPKIPNLIIYLCLISNSISTHRKNDYPIDCGKKWNH